MSSPTMHSQMFVKFRYTCPKRSSVALYSKQLALPFSHERNLHSLFMGV